MTGTDAETFYDALAPLFDVMTDWEARLASEGPFLHALLEERPLLKEVGARRVLDAACGSGGHALWLARQGTCETCPYEVVGADVSPVMIGLAQQKAAAAGSPRGERAGSVSFLVSDLAGLPSSLPGTGEGQGFDAVLCLGNSLPHLLTQADLVAALRGAAGVLKPGGLFVTQNLNYDLRWRTQPRWFAAQGGTVDGGEVLVWRFADYDLAAERIAFHVALFRKGRQGWDVQVHTTPQRPLFHADLLSALRAAGFGEFRAYGRMALPFEPFSAGQSGDLVVVASRIAD